MTTRKQAAVICLLVLAAVALYFCYLIAKPFLGPVVIAVMLAIVFHPLHARLQQFFQRPSLAAALSTILVLLIVAIPVALLAISSAENSARWLQSLREQSGSHGGWSPYLAQWIESLTRRLGNYVDLSQLDPQAELLRWAEEASRYMLSIGAAAVRNVLSFVLDTSCRFLQPVLLLSGRTKYSPGYFGNAPAVSRPDRKTFLGNQRNHDRQFLWRSRRGRGAGYFDGPGVLGSGIGSSDSVGRAYRSGVAWSRSWGRLWFGARLRFFCS